MVTTPTSNVPRPHAVSVMDVVIPGIDPWEAGAGQPYIWHFAFHSIPELPERLVQGHQAEYFDYSTTPSRPTVEDHSRGPAVYAQLTPPGGALTAGFNWYRTFLRTPLNKRTAKPTMTTRLPVPTCEKEGGQIGDYLDGLRLPG